MPLVMTTAPAMRSFFDFNLNSTISTTPINLSLLQNLLGAGQLLSNNPQLSRPVVQGNTTLYQARIRLDFMDVRIRFVGSEGVGIAPGDIYNTVRVLHWIAGPNFGSGITVNPLAGGAFQHIDVQDVLRVLDDQTAVLSTLAFDSTGDNSPGQEFIEKRIPLNVTIDAFNAGAVGTIWTSKAGNLVLSAVSDSNVPPNPIVEVNTRIYYRILAT